MYIQMPVAGHSELWPHIPYIQFHQLSCPSLQWTACRCCSIAVHGVGSGPGHIQFICVCQMQVYGCFSGKASNLHLKCDSNSKSPLLSSKSFLIILGVFLSFKTLFWWFNWQYLMVVIHFFLDLWWELRNTFEAFFVAIYKFITSEKYH